MPKEIGSYKGFSPQPSSGQSGTAPGSWNLRDQQHFKKLNEWPDAFVPPDYPTIQRSLRFNSADSAYLSRTPSATGNRRTWTWAGWVKRSGFGDHRLFSNGNALSNNIEEAFGFRANGTLEIWNVLQNVSFNWRVATAAVFRDASAWYHIVVKVDTTQATSSDRIVIYVNGAAVTSYSLANYPTQNSDLTTNSTVVHNIGASAVEIQSRFDGYLADIHFIDGQALDPTSFGEFSTTTGVWIPKTYTGTYGPNGFHLDFSDNSGTTSTTLGKDVAGSNNWTPNNFSVAAGAGNDSLIDTPTNISQTDTGVGGEVVGNYATANPLSALGTLSDGNLRIVSPPSYANARATIAFPNSGKWYLEATVASTTSTTVGANIGLSTGEAVLTGGFGGASGVYILNAAHILRIYNQTTLIANVSSVVSAGDIMQLAYDVDAGKMWVGINNNWRDSSGGTTGNPDTGTNQTFTLSANTYFPYLGGYDNTLDANFGQRPFAYTAPSGYKALCTTNLPDPVVAKPSEVMDVVTYTGNDTTQTISSLGFSPDLVWIKCRVGTRSHVLFDQVRGTGAALKTNTTAAEASPNPDGIVSAFTSNGFTVTGGSSSDLETNNLNDPLVAWTWDAGSSTVTNTDGSITSQVRANPSAGFSIVTYTGNGVSSATVGHGLGAPLGMIIYKNRTSNYSWIVWHNSFANANTYMILELTVAVDTIWDAPNVPSSTVFYPGSALSTNGNSNNIVAYCFAPVDGYSSFGSYTGNGSADGPFVYTGFRPRWILLKSSSASSSWALLDTARSSYNKTDEMLFANLSNAEVPDNADGIDVLSNGFKLRGNPSWGNSSSATYIYAAFAENPFKYSRAR